jgi:hypothetical protein
MAQSECTWLKMGDPGREKKGDRHLVGCVNDSEAPSPDLVVRSLFGKEKLSGRSLNATSYLTQIFGYSLVAFPTAFFQAMLYPVSTHH